MQCCDQCPSDAACCVWYACDSVVCSISLSLSHTLSLSDMTANSLLGRQGLPKAETRLIRNFVTASPAALRHLNFDSFRVLFSSLVRFTAAAGMHLVNYSLIHSNTCLQSPGYRATSEVLLLAACSLPKAYNLKSPGVGRYQEK